MSKLSLAARPPNDLNGALVFFFLPVGHDQDVYSWPWRTLTIMVACLGALLWSRSVEVESRREVERVVGLAFQYAEANPEAAISPAVHAVLPSPLRWWTATLVAEHDEDPSVSLELELAMLDARDAWRRMPVQRFGYVPAEHRPHTLLTAMFMHGGWGHLMGNMLILYLLGMVIECFWAGWAFLALYGLCGVAGALAHHWIAPSSDTPLVGASGAIAGVMAAFVLGHARTRINLFYFVFLFFFVRFGQVRVPALWLIGGWVVVQVWNAWGNANDGVSYAAHLGGFLVGSVCTLIARRRRWIATDAGFLWAGRQLEPPVPHGQQSQG